MKYLITGGAGFIGSHLADYLIKNNHEVYVIDNLSTGSLDNIQHLRQNPRFHLKISSVMDYHTLERWVLECDRIFHLAAAVGVKLIMEKPVETIETNIQGTENILRLAAYHDKKILVASTSEVYGKLMESHNGTVKLREEGDWQLGSTSKRRWAYACSKALDEFLALAYYDEKDLPVVVVRFFNTVGPRQTGAYGMVIPNFVQKALLHEPITVYGDGEQTRCFTYVSDAINAVVQLMNTPKAEGEVFNVGGEEEISMNNLAAKIKSLAESSSKITHIPYEEAYGDGFEDMRRRTPDLTKIKNTIGYRPTHATDDILKQVINYFQNKHAAIWSGRKAVME
jgi:UDP-glucose 4-epimerase